jgi:hypothetical protein
MSLESVISWVANLIEVGSFIFVIILFLKARAELARYLRSRRTTVSDRPWALAVGLGSDITGSVKEYLRDMRLEMPIETYVRQGYVPSRDLYPVLRDLLKIKDKLTQVGVTEVHLFYKGPVTVAMAIGAITDNWVPIKVYEYTQGRYEMDLVLEKETVKGLLVGGVMAEGEELLTKL